MSRTRWAISLFLLALLLPGQLLAQGLGMVQGTVVDATMQRPLAGVQVTVRGTSLAVTTAADGRFQIGNVPAGRQVISATLIGYATSEQTVTISPGAPVLANFTLTQEALQLEELVVTALGIERDARSVTTATQQIGGSQLTEVRNSNLVAALSGKLTGTHIINSNTPGGSSRIVIRGVTSLTGNNQPLFVVDGTPVSNASSGWSQGNSGYNLIDYGNAISDLNPDDIESLTVLKGPNAAALYGSRAANGAIIITTRKGRGAGSGQIEVSSQVTFSTPLRLPEYQNLYGQGSGGQYNYVDGKGNGVFDDNDESWGPRLDAGLKRVQFFSNGDSVPWVSNPNNVRDFFQAGRKVDTKASFAASSEYSNVRLSIGRTDEDSHYPGFNQERTNLSIVGGTTFSDRLKASASVQYTGTETRNRVAQGYGAHNVMWQFLWFGRQVDTRLLKERQYNEDGSQFNWNSNWNNNPYWTALVNRNEDERDRFLGTLSFDYQFTPWLTGLLRTGTDWSREQRRELYMAGTIGRNDVGANGAFGEANIYRQETNTDFILTGSWRDLGDFSLTTHFGAGRRDNNYHDNGLYISELVVPNLFTRANSAVDIPGLSDYRSRQRVNRVYGEAVLGYRNYLTLQLTGSNDWSSTLPAEHNSYFYPAISTGLILTDAFPGLRNNLLSHAKLRAGWAEVGNDAPPYQLVDPYGSDVPFQGAPRLSASNTLRNANLKPERTASWEIGTELGFLDDRLTLEVDYSQKATTNQIMAVEISPMTGFSSRYVNAGKVSSRSLEVGVNAIPVQLDNGFRWQVGAGFSRERGIVDELYGDLPSVVLGTYYNVSVEGRLGERLGNMYGRKYVRDGEGKIVVGSNGVPLNNANNPVELLGNYNPDWTGHLRNLLSYRGLDLGFLFHMRQGGVIYSQTANFGRRSGVLIESLVGREDGADQKDYVVPGVRIVDGKSVPNDVPVTAFAYHRGITGTSPIAEEFTYDASFIKLRELSLSYDLPRTFTQRMRLNGVRLALVGSNLWLKTDVPHIDPETAFSAGNVQGFEYGQIPSPRTFGFNISIRP
jgi:TonB-linked SusC/RagA family outer membrane protein